MLYSSFNIVVYIGLLWTSKSKLAYSIASFAVNGSFNTTPRPCQAAFPCVTKLCVFFSLLNSIFALIICLFLVFKKFNLLVINQIYLIIVPNQIGRASCRERV